MIDDPELKNVFSGILTGMGIYTPVDDIEIDGLMDTPGHHWSNPGVKQVSVRAGKAEFPFVLKILGEHSRREVEVYRFLSGIEDFPIPRLYHSEYDESKGEYRIVIERCLERRFPRPENFWKECGVLLARIHVPFWSNTDSLPSFFRIDSRENNSRDAVDALLVFPDSLADGDKILLDENLGISLYELYLSLKTIDKDRLRNRPGTETCLLHGSFHSPEIMWRKRPGGFIPLGVDWEGSRIGSPAEDLSFAFQNLLPENKYSLLDAFLDAYFSGLASHGIEPDRENIIPAARQAAFIKVTGSVIPFLLKTYLSVRDDPSYSKWCEWLKGSIPHTLRFVVGEIETGNIYSIP